MRSKVVEIVGGESNKMLIVKGGFLKYEGFV